MHAMKSTFARFFYLAAALIIGALLITATLLAQDGRLRPGDRVETPDGMKGSVVSVDPDATSNCYRILFDYQKGTGARGNNVCTYNYPEKLFLLNAEGRRIRDAGVATIEAPPDLPAAESPRLKSGDRVESPDGLKGTVVSVDDNLHSNCYLVLFDYQKGTGARGNNVCTYNYPARLFEIDAAGTRVRDASVAMDPANPATVFAPPPSNPPPPSSPPVSGVPPAPPVTTPGAGCAGEPLLELETVGKSPSETLFRDVLRQRSDKPADQFGEGRRVTTITRLTMGRPYTWRPGIDLQDLGTSDKTVYPILFRYSTCESFRTELRFVDAISDEEAVCYVEDGYGRWTCATRRSADVRHRATPR